MATYYVSADAADDLGTGAIGSPFQTLAHAVTHATTLGDIVKLKRDCILPWREQLTISTAGDATHQQVWETYGTGTAPRIYGSSQVSTWTNTSGNVWEAALTTSPQVIWFVNTDTTVSWGDAKTYNDLSELVNEYDWTWNGNKLYVYAATDPDARYTSIEVGLRTYGIYAAAGKDYITIDGIEIAYVNQGATDKGIGIQLGNNSIVQNCTIHHIAKQASDQGYGVYIPFSNNLVTTNTIHNIGRRGVNINSQGTGSTIASNNIIEHNTIYDSYHSGVDIQNNNGGGGCADNIVRYNYIYWTAGFDPALTGAGAGGIFVQGVSGYVVSGTKIYGNVVSGSSVFAIQASYYATNTEIYNNVVYKEHPDTPGESTGIKILITGSSGAIIENNIGVDFADGPLHIDNVAQVTTCNYNLWYNSEVGGIYTSVGGTSYHSNDQATYKSATGFDANGLWADPVFVSTSIPDFHLQATSPCIDTGTDVGLTEDYEGRAIPQGTGFDMGAYEYDTRTKTLFRK